MASGFKWKAIAVVIAFLLGAWYLKDTVRHATMSPAEQAAMSPEDLAKLRSNSLKLGLDLQGGMHMVLLVDKSKLSEKEAGDAVDRALEVIRNRIDQFGVTEPSIQRQGDDRILVQLPGVQDIEKAKALIGQTALLEFKIVQSAVSVQEVCGKIDEALYIRNQGQKAPGDTAAADSLLAGMNEDTERRPLTRYIGFMGQSDTDNPLVKEADFPTVQAMLDDPAVQRLIPGGVMFAWGREARLLGEEKYRDLYLLRKTADLTGSAIQNAIVQIGIDQDNPAAPGVELTMNSRGRTAFARITGENVGRRMAIVLDGQVHTAPGIRERIPRGVASISGGFTDTEAKILAIVLRAGALPAPIEILEERSVGPSLGKDSIDAGVKASLIAMGAVFLFMIFYYRISGLFANIALILNLLLVVAAMVWIDATLTLPGIAGLILTLGMAVDANVLINERIREELRLNKTIRAAVDAGYSRAFTAILDSNATVVLTTFFLLFYGTASIKGFAVTLIFGVTFSMFTAIVVTRVLFDIMIAKFNLRKLSI
ncbi:MAG: protein translocase subunit SecD [bacterium]